MIRYGTVRYGTVCYGMVRYGMVWYGMVRYGMVRQRTNLDKGCWVLCYYHCVCTVTINFIINFVNKSLTLHFVTILLKWFLYHSEVHQQLKLTLKTSF
jgi:hypothetical protein